MLFMFEPDLLLLRTAMEVNDLSALIESRRAIFFWRLDKADLFQPPDSRTPRCCRSAPNRSSTRRASRRSRNSTSRCRPGSTSSRRTAARA
jgi:hypothetical protein